MVATLEKRMTIEEYLDFECKSEIRHEYVAGKLFEMPYTTKNHGRIASNLNAELNLCLRGSNFEVFQESRLLHVPSCEGFYYPDLMIVPLEVESFKYKKRMEADLYPLALVEVASESTEENDREGKWKCYQKIPTLQQYILVSQTELFVETYVRQQEDPTKWTYTAYSEAGAKVPVMDCEIGVEAIYDRVKFVEPEHKTDG